MVFTDPLFLFAFLPVLLALYFAVPGERWRNPVLLAASLAFYVWGERQYAAIMAVSIAFNFIVGLRIDAARDDQARRRVLTLGIAVNLLGLIVFKYTGFVLESWNALGAKVGLPTVAVPAIRLPIGISFFTFHALSYLIDIYRTPGHALRRVRDLALYIVLFPQLIAGPIVRFGDVHQQLIARTVRPHDFITGIERFTLGMAKKTLIANPAGQRVDAIYALLPSEIGSCLAWWVAVLYAIQIYFDFSAYSDMAIGLARLFGFHFKENFNYPYTSSSITEFWRRWHISLSSWFRDYLYIPMGGNRLGPARTYAHLLIVFFLCGLWHGASWNFVIWGLFHGLFLVIERLESMQRLLQRIGRAGHVYTLLVVLVGWVFFRADTLTQSIGMLSTMAGVTKPLHALDWTGFVDAEIVLVVLLAVVCSTPWPARWTRLGLGSVERPASVLTYAALGVVFVLSLAKVAAGSYSPFIYFRF